MESKTLIAFLFTLAFAAMECQPVQEKNVTSTDIMSMMSQLSKKVEGLEFENLELNKKFLDVKMKQLQLDIKANEHDMKSQWDVAENDNEKEVQELHSITFDFPRQEQTLDWVKYLLPFPQMEELTTCFWVAPENFLEALFISYATPTYHNAFLVGILDENSLMVVLEDSEEYYFERFDFQAKAAVHICVMLSLKSKYLSVYESGKFKESKDYLGDDTKLEGGGTLYFGQDQDSMDGDFEASQAFKGKISNFMIWPRTLSAVEVHGVASSCTYPRDFILRPQLTNIQWNGNAHVILEDTCQTTGTGAP